MIRRKKNVDWDRILPPEDHVYIWSQIVPGDWYPMATFERLGIAILEHLEGASLDAVRLWGRFSANQFDGDARALIVPGEPIESLMRLRVMRNTLFDFPAFDIPMLADGHAYVAVTYHMSAKAEEAACHQTMGFCEGVLSLSGARDVEASFRERVWAGDGRTVIDLTWAHGG